MVEEKKKVCAALVRSLLEEIMMIVLVGLASSLLLAARDERSESAGGILALSVLSHYYRTGKLPKQDPAWLSTIKCKEFTSYVASGHRLRWRTRSIPATSPIAREGDTEIVTEELMNGHWVSTGDVHFFFKLPATAIWETRYVLNSRCKEVLLDTAVNASNLLADRCATFWISEKHAPRDLKALREYDSDNMEAWEGLRSSKKMTFRFSPAGHPTKVDIMIKGKLFMSYALGYPGNARYLKPLSYRAPARSRTACVSPSTIS